MTVQIIGSGSGNFDGARNVWGGTAGGTANAIVLTCTPTVPSHLNGREVTFIVGAATNTGAVTLQLDSTTSKSLVRGNGAPLMEGFLRPDSIVVAVYDGTNFRIKENVQGWVTLGRKFLSGASAYNLTLQNAYWKRYRFRLTDATPATNGDSIGLRTSTDGTNFAAGSADYRLGVLFNGSATPQAAVNVDVSAVTVFPSLYSSSVDAQTDIIFTPGSASQVPTARNSTRNINSGSVDQFITEYFGYRLLAQESLAVQFANATAARNFSANLYIEGLAA